MYVQERNLSTTEKMSVPCGFVLGTFLCICVRNAGERCCSRLIAHLLSFQSCVCVCGCVSALRMDLQNGVHVGKLNTLAGGSMLPGTLAFDSGKGYHHRALWHDLGHKR